MIPEEDFETWKLVVTTVTDDIPSFGEVLPDLQRLMNSISETNSLPGELCIYTEDFLGETFPNLVDSLLSLSLNLKRQEDNQNDAQIITDFFRSAIKLCISKITNSTTNISFLDDKLIDNYRKISSDLIKMIQILLKIFEKIDTSLEQNNEDIFLDQDIFFYFLDELKGNDKCYLAIDNICFLIKQICTKNNVSSDSCYNDDFVEEVLQTESTKLTLLFSIIQKNIKVTIFKSKLIDLQNSNNNTSQAPKEAEKEKFINYSTQISVLLKKSIPVYLIIAINNIRKFDTSQLNQIFEILIKSYEVDFTVSLEDQLALNFDILEPSYFSIYTVFLKSSFFDKHFYALKNYSILCDKADKISQNNKEYFDSLDKSINKPKYAISFISKEVLLKSIIDNFDLIQNLQFNKEFGEPLGNIYAFILHNKDGIITLDFIKSLMSNTQYIHAADLSSYYTIFEKITAELNQEDSDEITNFILHHIPPINAYYLEFLYNLAFNLQKNKFKEPFLKIRNFLWSLSFDETTNETPDIKEIARKKLSYLCNYASNEIIDQIIKEKLPKIQDSNETTNSNENEKEFILKLLSNSFNKNEKIDPDLCNKIIPFCLSDLTNKSMLDIVTRISQTQKITLDKEQIQLLSNVSNKFLSNILDSTSFDDKDIENFFYSTTNINNDLFDIIIKYVIEKNSHWKTSEIDYLTYLPFEKEDLLWNFSLKKSAVQEKFIKKLCEIYSNNDSTVLTDQQMIISFFDHIEKAFDDPEKRESCFFLLKKFIKTVDTTNPNLADIKKGDVNFEKKCIEVTIEGIEKKFYFSKNNIALVVYHEASKYLNIPINQLTLIYSQSPLPISHKLNMFLRITNVHFNPKIGVTSFNKFQHLRSVSPLTLIPHSNLMNKFISSLIEDDQNKTNNFDLMTLLSDLPTYEPIYIMLNHFKIMKKINFDHLFPINHPMFFLYSLNCLRQMGSDLKEEFIRTNGIQYFISALTQVNSLYLINEIIDYLAFAITSNELIEKHSNQLFDSLMRIIVCVHDFNHPDCIRLMRKLKISNIPPYKLDFNIELVKSEEKNVNPDDYIEGNYLDYNYLMESDILVDKYLIENRMKNQMISMMNFQRKVGKQFLPRKQKKEDQIVHIDNEIPLSHLILSVIAMSLIKDNFIIDSKIEAKSDESKEFVKMIFCDIISKLPLPSEYYEAFFSYLSVLNNYEFLRALGQHAKPPNDSIIQFIVDNLDIHFENIDFIFEFLKLIIDDIKNEVIRQIIFNFIFDNIFILERDVSITNSTFETALFIASKAPSELIINKIAEIGLPEFDKYNVVGKDFKLDKNPPGLKNLGCTCYFNSILQQFYYCPLLRQILIDYKGDDKLFKEIGSLFSQMKNRSLKVVSPKNVIDNWTCWDGEKLNPKIQQDASEFTIMMIDKLSPIIPNSMFNGNLLFKIEGINDEEGKFDSERNEPFSVLILPIDQLNTIEECLVAFSRPSFFTDKNQYFSDTLKRKIDAKQTDFVQELPDHLILQLKRFEYNYSTGVRMKINSPVSISSEIDISSICKFKENDELKCTKYHLTGIIQHMGSAMGGHYYSFVLDRETKTWYKCNDSDVNTITLDKVLEFANGFDSNAYLLFYDRNDINEVESLKENQNINDDMQHEMKINSNYNFFMSNAFKVFLDEISKRSELQELAIQLLLKIIPHENTEIDGNLFESLRLRLQKDTDLALSLQNKITDFKFTFYNECDATNYCVFTKILNPMFKHPIQQKLIQLAIDTIDYAIEVLPLSFFFFRILNIIVEQIIKQKADLLNDEKKNMDEIKILNESIDYICNKTTYLIKDGIKEYILMHNDFSPNYVLQSINITVIIRLFNVYETIPNEYIELLKDPAFLKSFYSSRSPTPSVLMKSYIRARELNLFDVNSFILSFFEKESYNIDLDYLLESIFTLFKEEGFSIVPKLKLKCNDSHIPPSQYSLFYPLLAQDQDTKDYLINHFNYWIPNIIMHDARMIGVQSHGFLISELNFGMKMMISPNDFEFLTNRGRDSYEIERHAYNFIQCLLGCLDEMKELMQKDDFTKGISFPPLKYRAMQLLKFAKGFIKIFNINFTGEYYSIDYSKLIDFGEFITTGHSHPCDPHIILVLKILKGNCSEKLLINSIPSKEIMMSPEILREIPFKQLENYLKNLCKIVNRKLNDGFSFSNDFYSRLFMMIIFNLININSVIHIDKLYEFMSKILESICDKERESSKIFIDYLDKNFQYCISNGFMSSIIGLTCLSIRRPFVHFINSLNLMPFSFSPSFIRDIILASGNQIDEVNDGNVVCYETLFNDISILSSFLCQKGNESDKKHKSSRKVIWDYLFNNTIKRIDECPEDKRFDLQNQLFKQFSSNYNADYFKLLIDIQEREKEIRSVTQFILLFMPQNQSNESINIENEIINYLIFFSQNSFDAFIQSFDILIQKVPEKLKETEFISDTLSNQIFSQQWEFVEKLCHIGFEGKTKEAIISILKFSGIIAHLNQDLKILNFIYENGILEDLFKKEDERQLSSMIIPFKLIMKYHNFFDLFIKDDERSLINEQSSSLLYKLKKCEINCQSKAELIETITQFIS